MEGSQSLTIFPAFAAAIAFANSPLATPPDNHYIFYTDGFLVNLGSPDVSMGWSWVQVLDGAGFFQSIAAYAHGIIRNWPSSTRAEVAAIHAVLTVVPPSAKVTICTDSQSAIDGLHLCTSSTYSNSRLYYKTTNFELWAIIERLISSKSLIVHTCKVKGHSGNFYNDYADSAHTAPSAILLSDLDQVSAHDFVLKYDDILCESNSRLLLKQFTQVQFMHDLTRLSRFHFTFALSSIPDYAIDWELTWFSLNFEPLMTRLLRENTRLIIALSNINFSWKIYLS